MNIILFGPPGAGKGTQAKNIAKKFNLYNISSGELLRNEIKKDSQLGRRIKSIIDKGSLVSDEIINRLIEKILTNKDYTDRLVFDGYPRNLKQAKNLDYIVKENKKKISCVLNLDVDKKSILKRILGRQNCSNCGQVFNEHFNPSSSKNHSCDPKFLQKRSDDNEKTIVNRFETYLGQTLPILDFYKEKKLLHKINGISKIEAIFGEICDIIDRLET